MRPEECREEVVVSVQAGMMWGPHPSEEGNWDVNCRSRDEAPAHIANTSQVNVYLDGKRVDRAGLPIQRRVATPAQDV